MAIRNAFILLLFISPFISAHNFDHEKCMRECEQLHNSDHDSRTQCSHACAERREQFARNCNKDKKGPRETPNPFVFGEESFEDEVKREHGRFKLLKNFWNLSPLLRDVDNYRVALFEFEPQTFVVPIHVDADAICYVIEGEGAVSILHEGSRESHSLEKGDIIRGWAGSIIYLINKSKSQKLVVAKLLLPLGKLGKVQAFHSSATEKADSYYQSFSTDILEAALNTKRDRLERFFGGQRKEMIVKASEEKIRAMSERSSKSEGGSWPFGRSKKPFNLLKKQPSHENNRGQLIEADFNDYEQLKDLNARVSYANISSDSMMAPFYNTRAFKMALVVKGSGYIEIISPYISGDGVEGQKEGNMGRTEHEQGTRRYTRVSSQLSEGNVFVIPPGYPSAIVAGRDQSLHIVSYEIPAENNERVFVAGKNNILGEMESEAKELAFGVSVEVADEVLKGQKMQVFVPGPEEWRRRHGGSSEKYNIMEVATGF